MELIYCILGGNSCSAVVRITVIAFIRISDEPSVRFHIIYGDAAWCGEQEKLYVLPFLQATKTLREIKVIPLLCFKSSTLEESEGSASRPGHFLPPGKTRYPLYRRLGGPQGRSGQVRKISPPPGFDLRTVQPVANRCTDWAIPAHQEKLLLLKMERSHKENRFFVTSTRGGWLDELREKHFRGKIRHETCINGITYSVPFWCHLISVHPTAVG
jgi:hypothetical protein